ncbi:hypothetical protein pb186bvf_005470 [Paramecium bursaria]
MNNNRTIDRQLMYLELRFLFGKGPLFEFKFHFLKIQYFHQFYLKKQALNRMRAKLGQKQRQKKQSYTKYNLIKLKKRRQDVEKSYNKLVEFHINKIPTKK